MMQKILTANWELEEEIHELKGKIRARDRALKLARTKILELKRSLKAQAMNTALLTPAQKEEQKRRLNSLERSAQ